MLLKEEALRGIYDSLNSSSTEREDYIFEYVFHRLDALSKKFPKDYEKLITRKITQGDDRFHSAMFAFSPWQTWSKELTDAMNYFVPVAPRTDSFDDIPF